MYMFDNDKLIFYMKIIFSSIGKNDVRFNNF